MNTEILVQMTLWMMAIQGSLGAFDTLYHHEGTENLPNRLGAHFELRIHAMRSCIYGFLFVGLAGFAWQGAWFGLLMGLFVFEIFLTLWDFVIEDKTRDLPATERVTHTILAVNGGAFLMLLCLVGWDWAQQPTAILWQPHGALSVFLALCGVGVTVSGVRDGLASLYLSKLNHNLMNKKTKNLFSKTPKNFFITGATGFIGQALVRQLLAEGHDVTILSRNAKTAARLFAGKVRVAEDFSGLSAHYAPNVVINLAGARILGMPWTAKRRAELLASREGLTQKLVDWMAKLPQKPDFLLSASAIGFYGIQEIGDDNQWDENQKPQNIFMSELCQRWETQAARAAEYGVQVKLMRFGLVLGRGGALPMMLLPIKLGVGGRLGSGKQWFSWIHLDDLIAAMAHLCQQNQEKSQENPVKKYNFVAPEAVSQLQFSQIAAKLLRRPAFMPTPALPMKLMLGEQSDLLLAGQRIIPKKLLSEKFEFTYPKLNQALRDLI